MRLPEIVARWAEPITEETHNFREDKDWYRLVAACRQAKLDMDYASECVEILSEFLAEVEQLSVDHHSLDPRAASQRLRQIHEFAAHALVTRSKF